MRFGLCEADKNGYKVHNVILYFIYANSEIFYSVISSCSETSIPQNCKNQILFTFNNKNIWTKEPCLIA